MAKSAHDIFTGIKDKQLLAQIAQKRAIDPQEHKKNLGKVIADDVHEAGLKKILEIIPEKHLEGFGVDTKKEDGETKLGRLALCKRIYSAMQDDDPQKFLEKLESKYFATLFDALGYDKPASKKYAEAFIEHADEIGVEHALSTLNITQLQAVAEAHGLTVESGSVNVLIDAILSGEDYKKEKKQTKVPKPSSKKPDLKKGISKIDLQHHYYREDLIKYCKDNNLVTSGAKKQLIDRIHNHLEGIEPKKATGKKRKAPAQKSKQPAKKAKTEKAEKSWRNLKQW